MADENLSAEQIAEKEKAEFEADLEGLSEEEKAQKIAEREALSKNNADIEEALKAERSRRKEAEEKLEETRRRAKERWEEDERKRKEQEGLEYDEDKPLTHREMKILLSENNERLKKETAESKAFEEARKLTESDVEANLVVEIWKNRQLAGSFPEQISEAYSIALGKRLIKREEELKRAISARDGEENIILNSQRQPARSSEPKLNPVDKTVISGMAWDSEKQAYKKTIAGGRKTFYVSRDLKKRWVEDVK